MVDSDDEESGRQLSINYRDSAGSLFRHAVCSPTALRYGRIRGVPVPALWCEGNGTVAGRVTGDIVPAEASPYRAEPVNTNVKTRPNSPISAEHTSIIVLTSPSFIVSALTPVQAALELRWSVVGLLPLGLMGVKS